MLNGDTVKLLRECNAGTKMAVYSMDEICDKIWMQISRMSSWHPKKNTSVLEMRSMHSWKNVMIRSKNRMRLQRECPG